MQNYKFYVTHSAVVTEVFPLGFDGAVFSYEKIDDGVVFKRKLSSKLTFQNNPKASQFDYNYFKAIEDSDQCTELSFEIKQLCNGTYISYWTGIFATTQGEWDLDRCTFTVLPELTDCILSNVQLNIFDIEDSVTVDAETTYTPSTRSYPAKKFDDLLHFLATSTCPNVVGIVSDFFQINPENVSTINYVMGTINPYTKMRVSALSDVQEPLPTNPATSEKISFLDVMKDLAVLFDVYWHIDANNYVRIEHITWYQGAMGMDLTTLTYAKYLTATNKYSYKMDDFPKFESFTMFESQQGCRLTYEGCGNINKSASEASFAVNRLYTDFFTLILNPGMVASNTRGLFLWCTDSDVMMGLNQNDELVLARLVLRFKRWNRPQLACTMEYFRSLDVGYNNVLPEFTEKNYGDLFVYSEKPNKKQVPITIPLCCSDNFEISDYLLTPFGNGFVDSASFSVKTDTLKLNLGYKINPDNVDKTPNQIPNLLVWLDATIGTSGSGGETLLWEDQSGNGNDFSQAPGIGEAPAVTCPGGVCRVRFGTGHSMYSAALQAFPGKRGSIFIVSQILGGGGDSSLISTSGGTGNVWDVSFYYTGGTYFYHSFEESKDYPIAKYVTGMQIFELIRRADDSEWIWMDGRAGDSSPLNPYIILGAEPNPFAVPNVQPDSNPIKLGKNGTISNVNGVDIFEVLIFDRDLTDIERQQIEFYLSKKWNIKLYS